MNYYLSIAKKSITLSYLLAIIASMIAVFSYAHQNQLKPGAILMIFTMKFFFISFLLSWLLVFLVTVLIKKFR